MDDGTLIERLIVAAYRLPFRFTKSKNGTRALQNSGGLVSAILSLSERFKSGSHNGNDEIVWVGSTERLPSYFSTGKIINEKFEIHPVILSRELNHLYYNGFCNNLIWPLFHYFPSFSVYNNDYFQAYKEANSRFCEEIVKIIKPGDFIWIHDYQLFLLPEMIRQRVPDATVGFFLHIPFPSFEIFRLLPRLWREAIINGMLGADLIGFHTHDYTQHFIKSVKRTTGYECHQNFISANDKLIKADAFPIGIDFDKFHKACLDKHVLIEKRKIKNNLPDQKLIFSVDRLDYSKGLLLRLKGYETFLDRFPKWHSKVVFNMVVIPSRDIIEKYKDMKKEIEYTIGRINGRYSSLSWRPIIYQYKSLTFNELVALYDLSDVGLITPLRDGMNLVAKEYVACQNENKGVLILSEMAGAAAELNEALIINPSDNIEMAEAIFYALEMDPAEKHLRIERMQRRIEDYNVFTWAFDFFKQTFDTKKQQEQMSVGFINDAILSQVSSDYQKSSQRILFLDYDGTLVSFNKYPELAVIDKHTIEIIKKLTSDSKNQVVIISGRTKDFLEKQFEDINVTLVAEHGYFIKKPTGKWKTTVTTDNQWKKTVLPILEEYANRCNGTFIEEKAGSVAWHYRNAESDFAQLRLHELRDDLAEIIRHKTNFEILEGDKVLEIKSGNYNKGLTAKTLVNDKNFDYILAAGDDKTDEDLFKALPEEAYTFKIGSFPTSAKYRLTNQGSLINLLNILTR